MLGQPAPEITCVAWNRSVQHILAAGTAAGVTHVWDLKRQKTLLSLQVRKMMRPIFQPIQNHTAIDVVLFMYTL